MRAGGPSPISETFPRPHVRRREVFVSQNTPNLII